MVPAEETLRNGEYLGAGKMEFERERERETEKFFFCVSFFRAENFLFLFLYLSHLLPLLLPL